jgi:multiple sugar transport system substrate-binding protein
MLQNSRMTRRRLLALSTAAVGGALVGPWGGGTDRAAASVTLSVSDPAYLQPGYKEQIDAIDETFARKYPGNSAKQVSPPFPQYHAQVLTQLQAGSPPDVIRIDDPQIQFFIERGWLEPLDPWLRKAGVNPAAFINSQKDAQRDGQTYAIPRETNPRVYIYNQELFRRAGIDVPTDLASFRESLRKTSNPSIGQFGMGIATKAGNPTGLFIQLMPIILGVGGQFFRGATPTATDPKVLEGLELVKEMWDGNQIPRGLDPVTINNLVSQGKIASIISGSFVILQTAKSNPEVAAHLTAAKNPLPSPTTMRATAWWGVPKQSKNKDLAAQYVLLLVDPDQGRRQVELTGTLPAPPGLVPPSFVAKYPWYKQVVEIGYAGRAVSYFPQQLGAKGNDALQIIGNAVLSVLYQNQPVEWAMKDAQGKLEQLIGS